MDKNTLLIISAVMASPFIGVWIKSMFDKKKMGAETHNLNISGEISIGDAWQKYAKKQEDDATSLRKEVADLKQMFTVLTQKFDTMQMEKNKEIEGLQDRVKKLEGILKSNNISF